MKKEMITVCIFASLMLITPFTTVAQENTVSNNLPEIPDDVEGLVAQIRTVVDEVLQKYGHISMVRSLCDAILNSLGLIGDTIICISLFIILIPLDLLYDFFRFFGISSYTLNALIFAVLYFMDEYCPWPNSLISKLPFKPIYTMLETKDNINTFEGCPCLQE